MNIWYRIKYQTPSYLLNSYTAIFSHRIYWSRSNSATSWMPNFVLLPPLVSGSTLNSPFQIILANCNRLHKLLQQLRHNFYVRKLRLRHQHFFRHPIHLELRILNWGWWIPYCSRYKRRPRGWLSSRYQRPAYWRNRSKRLGWFRHHWILELAWWWCIKQGYRPAWWAT